MRSLPFACLALGMIAAPVRAGFVTIDAFNNNTPATVSFNDGAGNSGTINTLLTQLSVTYSAGGTPLTILTFSIDLAHTASVGQVYTVNLRNDLTTAFTNGAQISSIYQAHGVADLTNNPDQAAAVQIALWDLSLNNHTPTFFVNDGDGTYSSGDPDVFKIALGNNPDASQIAALVNQYLGAPVSTTGPGAWLDADVPGAPAAHGPSLLQPIPEPSSLVLGLVAAGCLSAWGLWRTSPGRRHCMPHD
jgi:hypothetical protein